jgi:transglutaminase-like putative cysteine protease
MSPTSSTRYRVVHRTSYRYASEMTDGYTVTHLVPRETPWQRVEVADVVVDPEPSQRDDFVDSFGNHVVQIGLHRPHASLVVEAVSLVDVRARGDVSDATPWEDVTRAVDALRGDDALDIGPFRGSSPFVDLGAIGDRLVAIAEPSFTPGRGIVDAVRDLCHRIHVEFTFDRTSTDLSTPLGDVLEAKRGVCQDFAHLAAGCLRSLGLSARYVSGYIETDAAPGRVRLVGADASHAWCSVWTPLEGWVDLAPTNDHVPADRHVTVAWGRDYADVAPVRGVVIGPSSTQSLDVSVDVAPV